MSPTPPRSARPARFLLTAGVVLLVVTAALHLILGYPALRQAIDQGFIRPSKAMTPQELEAIWIAVSSDMALLAVLVVLHWRGASRRTFLMTAGLIPLVDALIIKLFTPGLHIAVPLLGVPGILIVLAGLLSPREP